MEPEYDPDAGTVGYLTWGEWDRFTRAWQTAHRNLSWWWVAGHLRSGDSDELKRRSTEQALPLPATWLAAHEITRLMNELNRWPELEDAARDRFGADLAMQMVREVETAAAKWPFSDRTHRVKHFRCQACQQMTLKYFPPNPSRRPDAITVETSARVGLAPDALRRVEVLDVVVRCTAPECRAVMDSHSFEIAVKLIEWEHSQDAKRRLDSGIGGSGDGQQEQADGVPVASAGSDSDHATVESSLALHSRSDESRRGDDH